MKPETLSVRKRTHSHFIRDLQAELLYKVTQKFGIIDKHFEEYGEIIPKETIEFAIDWGKVQRLIALPKTAKYGRICLQLYGICI